jgi:hypothetical protein
MHKNILTVIFLIIPLLLPAAASACICVKSNTIEKYNDASMIFIGHITMSEEVLNEAKSKNYNRQYGKSYIRTSYTVNEIIKGSPVDGGFVTSEVYLGNCSSIALVPGHDYVIFQYGTNEVSKCDGTAYYEQKDNNGMVMRTLRRLKSQNRITNHSSGTPNGAP